MSEKHPIRNGAIATVIGGLILAGLGWMFQELPQTKDLFGSAVRLIWQGITYPIRLPLWLVCGFGALLLWLSAGVIRRFLTSADSETYDEYLARVSSDIDPLQRQVLNFLARADGQPAGIDSIREHIGASNLHLSAALDALEYRKLIGFQTTWMDQRVCVLTTSGRDLILRDFACEHEGKTS